MSGKSDFASILAQWESRTEEDDSHRILREKGDTDDLFVPPSISQLRSLVPKARLDLHGLTGEQAVDRVSSFILNERKCKTAKVCIVTGKGLHSKGDAVIRDLVLAYLHGSRHVREIQSVP